MAVRIALAGRYTRDPLNHSGETARPSKAGLPSSTRPVHGPSFREMTTAPCVTPTSGDVEAVGLPPDAIPHIEHFNFEP